MQFAYSWMGTRIHLVLEEEVADAYNRAQDAWYAAQRDHREYHEREWNPRTEPIVIDWSDAERNAFNDVGHIINLLSKLNGGGFDIPEEEITSDYLVKL
ncbi:MAG: hypothetical protein ABWY25_04915 [Paenisporosarcina sp.]